MQLRQTENLAYYNFHKISYGQLTEIIKIMDNPTSSSNLGNEVVLLDTNAEAVQQLQDRVNLWTGTLDWQQELSEDDDNVDGLPLPSTFYIQRSQEKSDQANCFEGKPEKLFLHLISRTVLKKLDLKYLQETKTISLSIDNCPDRMSFTKLLRTGRYAGCIHLPPLKSDEDENEDIFLAREMGVVILLYSRGKQAIQGFVPTNMSEFVEKYLEATGVGRDHFEKKKVPVEIKKEIESVQKMETDEVAVESVQENQILSAQTFYDYELSSITDLENNLVAKLSKELTGIQNKNLQFFKGCKWAPDGSCLMSNSDDDVIRIFNVPESLYSSRSKEQQQNEILEMESALEIKEGGQIYDYCWYPQMSSYDPVSCCLLTTTADAPVHLWDAFNGKLRASYLAYDHLDQVVAARSISFDPSGEQIHCGFDTSIRTFDISRPGRQCIERKLKHPQITELNQPGIVSCIAVNPALRSVMAVGSYLKTVGLYHEDGTVLCMLQGHLGGVTHLKFSNDGTKLFSGSRKDSRLICWDMRYMGESYKIYERAVCTNQRIYFDITTNDKFLITGGTDGVVKVWDLTQENLEPTSKFQASSDCVNGISINPFIPLLATSSGQRHLEKTSQSFSDDEASEDEDELTQETDIKLWKL